MVKKLKVTDYIYYGVKLKVKSITDVESNRVKVEFKPLYCRGELSELKDLTLVYIGQRSNKGLFSFSHPVNSQIQTYAITLRDEKIGVNKFQTNRLFVEKPGRKELVF
jgi:hypothetical protein